MTRTRSRRGKSGDGKKKPRAQRLRNGGVNRGRGEICVTAAAWGSPTEQQGMLLMDMSDIVLTSSLWIVQHTLNHIRMCKHTVQHTDTCISPNHNLPSFRLNAAKHTSTKTHLKWAKAVVLLTVPIDSTRNWCHQYININVRNVHHGW